MPYSYAAHQQYLAPAQWALQDIHHVSFFSVHEDGTDLMHWMRNYLFFHMPVLVIGFSGSCQILSFANKGHMFPQRKVWQMVRWWFWNLGRKSSDATHNFVFSVLSMFLSFSLVKIIKKLTTVCTAHKMFKICKICVYNIKNIFI